MWMSGCELLTWFSGTTNTLNYLIYRLRFKLCTKVRRFFAFRCVVLYRCLLFSFSITCWWNKVAHYCLRIIIKITTALERYNHRVAFRARLSVPFRLTVFAFPRVRRVARFRTDAVVAVAAVETLLIMSRAGSTERDRSASAPSKAGGLIRSMPIPRTARDNLRNEFRAGLAWNSGYFAAEQPTAQITN